MTEWPHTKSFYRGSFRTFLDISIRSEKKTNQNRKHFRQTRDTLVTLGLITKTKSWHQ